MKHVIFAAFTALIIGIGVYSQDVWAVDITKNCQSVSQQDCALINEKRLDKDATGGPSAVKTGINTALYLLGAISVIMIVIGGFKYTASNGDSSIITSAKNTIFFAVIGVIVAIMAYAIVNFVITRI